MSNIKESYSYEKGFYQTADCGCELTNPMTNFTVFKCCSGGGWLLSGEPTKPKDYLEKCMIRAHKPNLKDANLLAGVKK